MRNRVRELRLEAGLSQEECGERAGVTRQTIISIEKGHFDPRLSLAFRLATLFDVRVDEVFLPDEAESGG